MAIHGHASRDRFKVKVVFRADASVKIGTGHVMRCLTLADELARQGHQCVFIVRDHPGHLGELIASKKHELHLLSCADGIAPMVDDNGGPHAEWLGVSWQHDASQVLGILAQIKADWLVVDHYALDARWEREVGKAVGRIMVIDDLADRKHRCDLLLDQNLGREAADYDQFISKECLRLIGPQYALLRPEFAQLRERSLLRRKNPELKRILISLGGVDRENVTGRILSVLAGSGLSSEIVLDVVLGAAAPHLKEVQHQAKNIPFVATVSVSVTDMAARMCLADLCISAAGSTSWELCCLGVPAIQVCLAENQRQAMKYLAAAGATYNVSMNCMGTGLLKLLELMMDVDVMSSAAYKSAGIVDGLGVQRVRRWLDEK